MIGVLAINHYAEDPGAAYSTFDCDLLLKPAPRNFQKAVRALVAEGYALEAGGEPLPAPDASILRRIFRARGLVRGRKPGKLAIDLVLDGGERPYAAWRRRSRLFRSGRTPIRCGALADLLAAKASAGRPKDKAFLALYRCALSPAAGRTPRRPRRGPAPKAGQA